MSLRATFRAFRVVGAKRKPRLTGRQVSNIRRDTRRRKRRK